MLAAVFILYECVSENSQSEYPFRVALYYGIIGPPYMMFIAIPLTGLVLALISLLVWPGLRWRRARALWVLGVAVWCAWWLIMAYEMCAD